MWLYLSRPVVVKSSWRGQTYVVELPEVQVGAENNTNPLETGHFQTPLSRALLRRAHRGAELALSLRESVVPKYEMLAGPGETMVLRVTLPRAKRQYAPEVPAPRPVATDTSSQPSPAVPAPGGPGPNP